MSTSHSVRRHLRVDIEEYDASIRRFIPGYETMLGEAAAAVAASLALHHVRTLEEKASLFARIFGALRPGGVFVNADVTLPAEERARGAAWRAWAAHLVASGIAEARAWVHFAEWADEDTYFPLEAELGALERGGFRARCAWRDRVSTVVVAVKPNRT